jgi:hypothetical protein
VEVFGWLIMLEGTLMLLTPAGAASILQLPTLVEEAENYFRLIGLLVGGLGMIYVVSGRMNAEGFAFASMLDLTFHGEHRTALLKRAGVPIATGTVFHRAFLDILSGGSPQPRQGR